MAIDNWWSQLHDPAIDGLMAGALADNPTLLQASERLNEARATYTVNQAQRLPQVSATGNVNRAESENPVSIGGPYTVMDNSGSLGPSLSWELDLWGSLRESARAARARLDERSADAQSARLSLAAQMADAVLNLRACHYSLAVRDSDIASRQTELELMRMRLAVGNVAAVDEANAQTNLAAARTSRISQQEQCTRDVDALVALSGRHADAVLALVAVPLSRPPGENSRETLSLLESKLDVVMPAAPPLQPAMPAVVLLVHPNVVSAERETAAAWAEIAVARADRLPQINLAAALTGQWLNAFSTTAHFNTWSAGANLYAPLIDGGSGAANVRGAQARYREAVAALRLAVRNAAQDIEDALAAQLSAEERTATSQLEVAAARTTLRANEERWKAGSISMFELQIARRQFNSAQEDAIAAVRDRALAWVELVRASSTTFQAGQPPATAAMVRRDEFKSPGGIQSHE